MSKKSKSKKIVLSDDEEVEELDEYVLSDDEKNEEDDEEIGDDEYDENYDETAKENEDIDNLDNYENNDNNCEYRTDELDLNDIVENVRKPHKSNVVPNDQRITKPIMTKYEHAKIKGVRAIQLSNGAKPLVKGDIKNKTPQEIAELEIAHGMCPLIVERPMPDGLVERWKVAELTYYEN